MSEESGNVRVERILLSVEAPAGNLTDANSGLNYAISRMEVLNKQLDSAIVKWKQLGGVAGSVRLSGGASAGTSPAAAQNALQQEIKDNNLRIKSIQDVYNAEEKINENRLAQAKKFSNQSGSLKQENIYKADKDGNLKISRVRVTQNFAKDEAQKAKEADDLAEQMARGREEAAKRRRQSQLLAPMAAEHQAQVAAKAERAQDAAMMKAQKAKEAQEALDNYVGKNLPQNVAHVTAWAASVGILYGSLTLVKRSLEENMAIGRQQAILSQIFKGNAAAAATLTEKVLSLAAANGQSAALAMESATEFARIFHTQADVLTATNAALMGVNVSGMTVGQTTEFLSMMTQVYSLRASELGGVIGQLAYISQNYNATNQDMVRGMEASAEAAKEAGFSYTQTFGIIAGGVSATKQSGTAIGNTLKTLTTQMSNPEIQDKLRLGAGIEVQGIDGLREMPAVLNDIFLGFQRMNESERRSFLFNVGGRQNATRLAGILDKFVEGQVKAINSQLNLNAAESENSKIMDTLKGQLGGLIAEWDRFLLLQGKIPMQGLQDIATGLKNILAIANAPGVRVLTTLLGAFGIGVGARMLFSGFKMDFSKMDGKHGIIVNTIKALKGDAKGLGEAFNMTASAGVERFNSLASKLPAAIKPGTLAVKEMGFAARFAAVSFVALTDVILPLLALWGMLKGLNALKGYVTGDDAQDHGVQAYQKASKAVEAHASRRDLISLASEAIADSRTPDGRKKNIAKDIAAAQLPFGTPQEIANLAKQNQLLIEQGQLQELLLQLKRSQLDADKDSMREKIAAQAQLQTNITMEEQAISGLQEFNQAGAFERLFMMPAKDAFEDSDDAIERHKKKLEEYKQALEELAKNKIIDNASESYMNRMVRAKSTEAAREIALGGISEQYGQVTTDSPLDKYNLHRSELESRQKYLQQERDALNNPEYMKGLNLTQEQKIDVLKSSGEAYSKNLSELLLSNHPNAIAQREQATRLSIDSRMGKSYGSMFAVGDGEGEQLANQYKGAKSYYKDLDKVRYSNNSSEEQRESAKTVQRELHVQMVEQIIRSQEKLNDLNREELNILIQKRREYERSLLTAGPGELLRKLAVNQLNKNGMNSGKFFAMDQGGRGDFLSLPENSEEIRAVRRSRKAILQTFGQMDPTTLGDISIKASPDRRNLMPNVNSQMDSQIGKDILIAASALNSVAKESQQLANAFNNLSSRVDSMFNGKATAKAVPKTAQAPGVL